MIKTPVRSPRANSYAERFVGTLRRECPDHVLILGERHLRRILAEYARHYNGYGPHQGLQQEPPERQSSQTTDITARFGRRQVRWYRHPYPDPGDGQATRDAIDTALTAAETCGVPQRCIGG